MERNRLVETRRNTQSWRYVNFNRRGASRWYYGYASPGPNPLPRTYANAETFWKFRGTPDQAVWENQWRNDSLWAGKTFAFATFREPGNESNAASIPRYTKRSVVADRAFEEMRRFYYYQTHAESTLVDFPKAIRNVIAHEFGHSVGMFHYSGSNQTYLHIMDDIRFFTSGPDSGRMIPFDSTFTPASRNQFSITAGGQ